MRYLGNAFLKNVWAKTLEIKQKNPGTSYGGDPFDVPDISALEGRKAVHGKGSPPHAQQSKVGGLRVSLKKRA